MRGARPSSDPISALQNVHLSTKVDRELAQPVLFVILSRDVHGCMAPWVSSQDLLRVQTTIDHRLRKSGWAAKRKQKSVLAAIPVTGGLQAYRPCGTVKTI